ncbi:hypothetical protein AAHB46_01765 [Bacillus paranthracis]
MMRVLIEFLLFMCCLASIFQLALVIRRYMAIKKIGYYVKQKSLVNHV